MSSGPSLYRRHRPRTFDDVVGQEHVVRTLRNAVEQGKVHHAYLFVGSRGTGKTSMAKILAACLNCHDTHTVPGARRLTREGTDGGQPGANPLAAPVMPPDPAQAPEVRSQVSPRPPAGNQPRAPSHASSPTGAG